jgi:hypothetical protein
MRGAFMDNKLTPDIVKVKKYLDLLWPTAEDGFLGVHYKTENGLPSKFFSVSKTNLAADAVARLADKYDVYTCCGLFGKRPPAGRGEEQGVIAIPGFWYDLDTEDGVHNKVGRKPCVESAVSFLLRDIGLEPSLLIHSGGGLHAYWLFNEALYFNNGERQEVRNISIRWQEYLASKQKKRGWTCVDKTPALNWILRPAGTFNYKADPITVEIIRENPIRYELSDIQDFLETVSIQDDQDQEETASGIDGLEIPFSVKQLIAGKTPEGKRSEAIASVITALVKARLNDNQILTVFENHPHGIGAKYMGEKKGRKKWLLGEIKRSREFVGRTTGSVGDDEEVEVTEWPQPMAPEAFAGYPGEFVELATKNSEADPHAVLMHFITRFGVEVGRRPYHYIDDSVHHARLNAVIVGNSSKARKGTASKPVKRLFNFDAITDEETSPFITPAAHADGPLSTGEGLIYEVRDPRYEIKIDKKTRDEEELLVDAGVEDKRLYVLEQEFASVLTSARREGNTLSTVIRCAWDGDTLAPMTKNNRIAATGAHVGITGHITLPELNRKMDDTEAFNGFANRFLWVCAKRHGIVPFASPIPQKHLGEFQWVLKKMLGGIQHIQEMQLGGDARELWAGTYPDLSKDHPGLVGAVINRAEAQVRRLSMIYALLDGQTTISINHLESALAVWRYCEDSARFIFGGRQQNKHAQKILEMLQEKGQCTSKDIYDLFARNITKVQIETAIGELVGQGKVEIDKKKKTGQKGRPTVIFRIVR